MYMFTVNNEIIDENRGSIYIIDIMPTILLIKLFNIIIRIIIM